MINNFTRFSSRRVALRASATAAIVRSSFREPKVCLSGVKKNVALSFRTRHGASADEIPKPQSTLHQRSKLGRSTTQETEEQRDRVLPVEFLGPCTMHTIPLPYPSLPSVTIPVALSIARFSGPMRKIY